MDEAHKVVVPHHCKSLLEFASQTVSSTLRVQTNAVSDISPCTHVKFYALSTSEITYWAVKVSYKLES